MDDIKWRVRPFCWPTPGTVADGETGPRACWWIVDGRPMVFMCEGRARFRIWGKIAGEGLRVVAEGSEEAMRAAARLMAVPQERCAEASHDL